MGKDAAQASSLSPADAGAASPKNTVLKQLAEASNSDGSIFTQLANNPFFTAVCLQKGPRRPLSLIEGIGIWSCRPGSRGEIWVEGSAKKCRIAAAAHAG